MDSFLHNAKVIIIDCQTTGASPAHGALLEIAWQVSSAAKLEPEVARSFLVKAEVVPSIPQRVSRMTGIKLKDVQKKGVTLHEVHKALRADLEAYGPLSHSVIHFARFERSFLEDLFAKVEEARALPFELICTHEISRRLFPNLPARSLRALAGYFATPLGELKRSMAHIGATASVWRALVDELAKKDIRTVGELTQWLSQKEKMKKEKHEYPIDRLQRLALPSTPGIYQMLGRNGEILYVGKATRLKERVNSYFRGRKGRDGKKLEMLTQVWDIAIMPCRTALEAALLEADEIKKHHPPYNVSLKQGDRRLYFYSRDFSVVSSFQSNETPYGPFTTGTSIDHAQRIVASVREGAFDPALFWGSFTKGELASGWEEFREEFRIESEGLSVRKLIALGARLARKEAKTESVFADEVEYDFADSDDASGAYHSFCRRLFESFVRARLLTRLLNADIDWKEGNKKFKLCFVGGKPYTKRPKKEVVANLPWQNLSVQEYDRVAVLAAELKRAGQLETAVNGLRPNRGRAN